MTKLLLIIIAFCSFIADVSGQVAVEGQIGGANFLGLTINSRFQILISKENDHRLTPSFGVGILSPAWDAPTMIVNAGLSYSHNAWGIGTEVSGFTENPFIPSDQPRDFVDMIIYPNFNYTFTFDSSWYVRLSAGAYFSYSKFTNPVTDISRLRYEGDVLPGAGISVGYILK